MHLAIRLLNRKELASKLLTKAYRNTYLYIKAKVLTSSDLNLIIDKLTNIRRERINSLYLNNLTFRAFFINS